MRRPFSFGVSPQLAAHYADGGWLVRLAQGVYAFPNDDFGAYGALKFLQQRVPNLHVGGKSALALQGVRHNLGSRDTLVLWGDNRFALPVLAQDELYASKLVAVLDRQHPRDLFDVWQLYASGGISNDMVECFVVYLAGHNRPPHEVLFGNDKNIAGEYERAFVGMTEVDCSLDTLLEARV